MPWVIGIDEAGYGPNLGPLVMSAVACRVAAEADLWDVLRAAVRRRDEPKDDRLVVADSKDVYTPAKGLRDLETAVLAAVGAHVSVRSYVRALAAASADELLGEPWYTGRTRLPLEANRREVKQAALLLERAAAAAAVCWARPLSVVVCPPRFNDWLERWGSKGAVLAEGFAALLQHHCLASDDEPMVIYVDKHGGRNHYAAMIQHALPDTFVLAVEEGADCSRYQVLGLARAITVVFEPRADGRHFCVALASMASKYLRELLMTEFNRFWQEHVAELKPTAGYPSDSYRFFQEILPASRRLGIPESALWRRK